MRCVAIGGVPATGKTTLMNKLFEQMGSPKGFKYGLVRGHVCKERNIALLGIYGTGETFAGTDKLAMNVNPHFHKYTERKDRNILFEGDRLFTLNNLLHLKQLYETRVIILEADEQTLHQRHQDRGDGQTDKFLQGRKTKITNIKQGLNGDYQLCSLLDIADTTNLAQDVLDWLSHK